MSVCTRRCLFYGGRLKRPAGGGVLGRLETPSKLRAKSWCGPKEQTTGDTWVLRCLRHFIELPQLDLTYKNDK